MTITGFVDGSTQGKELVLSVDVCVVGSGAGGSVAAATLANAGFQVLVLEEGGHYTRADFRMREDQAFPQLYQEDGGRATEDQAISILQGRSVGGSTTVNWTTCFRTPAKVLEHWARHHGVHGFEEKDLVPHWEAVEERLHIQEIPFEEINRNNRTLWDGCKANGWDVALIRRNVRGCLKSGYCGMGCPVDAKQSMLVTYLPDAVAKGAAVLSHAKVERLRTNGRQVEAVEGALLAADGRTQVGRFSVRPKRLILAGGAINTPALLLRSSIDHAGMVGKRTFLHPTIAQFGIYKEPINGFYGAPQSVASHHFAHRDDEVGFVLETAPVHPMLAALATPGFGQEHRDRISQLAYTSGHIALHVDGFHPDVPGGTVKLRKSGAPVVSYPIPDRLWRAMRESAKTMAKLQLSGGAVQTSTAHDPPVILRSESELGRIDQARWEPNGLAVFSAHVMGGCALGDNKSEGVVRSEDFALHALDGVHVIDGSVFPTSLGVNPQLTIYGLARLAATRLAQTWKPA